MLLWHIVQGCVYICAANPHYINCAVLVTLYLLTSAVYIVTIAGHHELLQVGVWAGSGHHGVTPGLAAHAATHRVTGELHQLCRCSVDTLNFFSSRDPIYLSEVIVLLSQYGDLPLQGHDQRLPGVLQHSDVTRLSRVTLCPSWHALVVTRELISQGKVVWVRSLIFQLR